MSYMNNTFQSNYDYSKDKNFMSTDIGPSMREMKAQRRRARPAENAGADNPYIPQFISKAPWYAQDDEAVERLAHQRITKEETPSGGRSSLGGEWYARGKRAGPAATKYRKGACENCGAMTHKAKECMERPRKRGARWTGKDIQADEIVQDIDLSWDAKRDRWNGYDAEEYKRVVERYELAEKLAKQTSSVGEGGKHSDATDKTGGSDSMKTSGASTPATTVSKTETNAPLPSQSLRMREDIVAYLRTDQPDLQYEPKSRSMRDKTGAQYIDDSASGEGFVRASGGDKEKFEQLQLFAWEAERQGDRMHVVANPTAAEVLARKKLEGRSTDRKRIDESVLQRYGIQTEHSSEQLNAASEADKETTDATKHRKVEGPDGEASQKEESAREKKTTETKAEENAEKNLVIVEE
ncbi:splicing factor Slu7 [Schizosaccharomyces japonicus yFS275]|uniref:Pre-mRNA-splicing factor SLU7 n=1 Tax=Schizosaccharomyces japonicus (strain yFS275 / FY16936) TaxID=402676 RepID=B6K011_SCHJY|nr:splicing factor Slu7 [Schizosaccharomyces japonicus yFS275]EEB06161.1 splicing factor Slu7 [Schizosaccharomyces japonicus yFS275]